MLSSYKVIAKPFLRSIHRVKTVQAAIVLLAIFLPSLVGAAAPIRQQTVLFQDKISPSTSYEGNYLNAMRAPGLTGYNYQRAWIGHDETQNYRTLMLWDDIQDYFAPSATIVSAVLSIYIDADQSDGTPINLEVHRVTTEWGKYKTYGISYAAADQPALPGMVCWDAAKKDQAAWKTPGGDYIADTEDTVNITDASKWYDFNVVNSVQYWIGHGKNYGVLFKARDENTRHKTKRRIATVISTNQLNPILKITARPSVIRNMEWQWNSSPAPINLENYFYDADGDSFSYQVKNGDSPAHIAIAIDPSTHIVTFTPKTGWYGTETVTFRATAGGESVDSNQVTLKVYRTVTIPDQSWDVNTSRNTAFDLDNYFPSCSSPTVSSTGNSPIDVSIDSTTHQVSISQPKDYIGQKTVTFSCDKAGVKQVSNPVTLKVRNTSAFNAPPERKATLRFKNGYYPSANYDGCDTNSITGGVFKNGAGLNNRYQQLFAGNRFYKNQFRLLWKFDTDAWIPPSKHITIDSATLSMYCESGADINRVDLSVHRLTKPWGAASRYASYTDTPASAGEINWTWAALDTTAWTTPGGDFTKTDISTTPVSVHGEWYHFDVTRLYQYWIDNDGTNFGGLIKAVTEQDNTEDWKKFSGARKTVNKGSTRPELIVTYHPSFIPDQEWAAKEINAAPFDLDDYFSDPNPLDTLVYTADTKKCPHISVTINKKNQPTFTPQAGWYGTESVVFNASDQFSNTDSNTVTLRVVNYVRVPDQRWKMGSNYPNAFDLDDYFHNSAGLTFTYRQAADHHINVSIDPSSHVVSFSQDAGWHGAESVTFFTDDRTGKYQQSYSVTLTVDRPKFQNINSGHPRIFMTDANMSTLKSRAATDLINEYRALYENMYEPSANIPGGPEALRDYVIMCGFRYLSGDGDEWAKKAMQVVNEKAAGYTTALTGSDISYAAVGMDIYALAYDYFYAYLSEAEKAVLIQTMNAQADAIMSRMQVYVDYHNYAVQAWTGVGIAALATYGNNPRAVEFLDSGRKNRRGRFGRPQRSSGI